jgi:drug/metabolite transporter (DMT)-like permease
MSQALSTPIAVQAPAQMSRSLALGLFAVVVVTWGVNWSVTKVIVTSIPPLWTTSFRTAIGVAALFVILRARGQLVVPPRGDWPVVAVASLCHMVIFSALIAFGLTLVPVGRSIVLGYTTPLWVAPGAWLFLGERMTRARLLGVALGLTGLAVLFNPLALDWSDGWALVGNALVLLAALFWAISILYMRHHAWVSTPFQQVFWQSLVATIVLSAMALAVHGLPQITWTPALVAGLAYGGLCGTVLAGWAMTMVNRSLPALTTSLGILATPVVGVAVSALTLGEPLDLALLAAMVMIIAGIAIGTLPGRAGGR